MESMIFKALDMKKIREHCQSNGKYDFILPWKFPRKGEMMVHFTVLTSSIFEDIGYVTNVDFGRGHSADMKTKMRPEFLKMLYNSFSREDDEKVATIVDKKSYSYRNEHNMTILIYKPFSSFTPLIEKSSGATFYQVEDEYVALSRMNRYHSYSDVNHYIVDETGVYYHTRKIDKSELDKQIKLKERHGGIVLNGVNVLSADDVDDDADIRTVFRPDRVIFDERLYDNLSPNDIVETTELDESPKAYIVKRMTDTTVHLLSAHGGRRDDWGTDVSKADVRKIDMLVPVDTDNWYLAISDKDHLCAGPLLMEGENFALMYAKAHSTYSRREDYREIYIDKRKSIRLDWMNQSVYEHRHESELYQSMVQLTDDKYSVAYALILMRLYYLHKSNVNQWVKMIGNMVSTAYGGYQAENRLADYLFNEYKEALRQMIEY